MDKKELFYNLIDESGYDVPYVAKKMNLTTKELQDIVDNDLDFLSGQMIIIADILHIQNPFNFFYG